jgi:hypothetical protein
MAGFSQALEKYEIRNGFALVIVNTTFRGRGLWLPERPGAENDKKEIKRFCQNIGFTVDNRNNLEAEEMRNVCRTISWNEDFRSYDAFMCFISSHGDEGGIYGVDGECIRIDDIARMFKGKVSLVNKPKLFFMQTCRGRNIDRGISNTQADHGALPRPLTIHLPVEADVLVAYSSLDGYESYRDIEEGSWFITVLIKVLNEHAHNMKLTDVLTIVNKRVADMVTAEGKKQMPCFLSTLRKAVHFNGNVVESSTDIQPYPAADSTEL